MKTLKYVSIGLFLTIFYSLVTVLYFKTGKNLTDESIFFYNYCFVFVAAFECAVGFFLMKILTPAIFRELEILQGIGRKVIIFFIVLAVIAVFTVLNYFDVHSTGEYYSIVIFDMFTFMYLTIVSYFFVFLLEEKRWANGKRKTPRA